MKRIKRHKIKQETAETSSSRFRDQEEHDLAYYIHDRVELMHQVFSVIKPKELKAMAPECVYHITVDDLQELCTEELLGISSKRLCAILDGADPPTDTESSSSENNLETISLDSISSDDEVLSQHSTKKK
ncbi:jg27722, partial [Pararge aegeria aegeria]